jgi:glycosyltransferase involved in cell wall biosynthesis
MANHKAVSIVLPVRNGEKYLNTAIESVTGFAREFDQIITIDDGSTDLTFQILEKWSKKDSRVTLIRTEGIGLADSLNLAISSAVHDWIARADVDDIYSPDRINTQINLISSGVVAIFSDYKIFSSSGDYLGEIPTAVFPLPMKLSLVSGNRTPHPSVLFKKDAAIAAGGYLNSEFPAEDLGLWVRIQKLGELISSPVSLLNYTVSANSVTSSQRKSSIQQRRRVTSKLVFSNKEIDQFCFDFNSYIRDYLTLSAGHKRIVLLYKDLFHWNAKNKKRFPINRLFNLVLLSPRFHFSIVNLFLEFLKRRIKRLLSKFGLFSHS